MARLFGTDGVRGVANDSLTPELAYHLGRAAAYIFGQDKEHPTFLIGRDTRRSGTMLADILAAGIASAGGECCMVGVIPTPAIAYLTGMRLEEIATLHVRQFHVDALGNPYIHTEDGKNENKIGRAHV